MDTIFTVRNEDLERLNSKEAVDFFRELLWAEATTLGIGKNLINVPSAITVADGGIDAEIRDVEIQGGQGIIKPGLTRYQIKTGKIKISQDHHIKEILFKEGSEDLRPMIKSCLDKDGTLVIVLFGFDNPETKDDQIINKFKEKLSPIDEKYDEAKIEIWRQNNLIGFLKPFPSLVLELKGLGDLPFQTHKTWSSNKDMSCEFVKTADFDEKAKSIQEILRSSDQAKHLRIIGEAGCGKTRFILEATRTEDISPLVIYTKASGFINGPLFGYICRQDNSFHVIIVVDECDLLQRINIWNPLANLGSRIKIISIYNEEKYEEHDIYYPKIPRLSATEMKNIVLSYGVPEDQVNKWIELAGDSPRFAHMIGINLKYYPDEILRPVEGIYDRIVAGYDDPNSDEVKRRKTVLMHLALFKRFGYRPPVEGEANAIAGIIEKVDRNITKGKFLEIVKTLADMKILQGENILYITPKALHIWMWIEWWKTYGHSFNLDDFLQDIPDGTSLREWFYEMFKYAKESEAASHTVRDLLGGSGPFQNHEYLKTELGSRFFSALTDADPKQALEYLKKTIGTKSKDELLRFTTGRREIVWALEKTAMQRDLFADSARLLLALGEAENESWSNNASGVFAGLFSPGYGRVAPTKASPQERFPVLKETMESKSKERRLLALRAVEQALESQNFTRIAGSEYQGLRKLPQWMPKTYGELFDAYRHVWRMMLEHLDSLPADEQQQAIDVLLQRSRGLIQIQDLADMIVGAMHKLIEKPYTNEKEVLAEVIRILHYDGKELPPETRQSLESIQEKLVGKDFSSLMKRYVGMNLLEDKFDEKGNHADQTLPKIEELVQQVIANNELLHPELEWLVTDEAQNGFQFGYELGKQDKNFSLLPRLLEAQRAAGGNASVFFLGGYFRAVFEQNKQEWENQLDLLIKDDKLNIYIPELTWRSGMSDQAAIRILHLAKEGVIGISQFRMFGSGSATKNLSENVLMEWIEYLLSSSETYATYIVLNLYHSYYLRKESNLIPPEELTLRLLTHQSLLQEYDKSKYGPMDDYHWTEIGKAFVKFYPKRSLELADKMLEHFEEKDTIFGSFESQTQVVLNEIAQRYPREVWKQITKYLGPPIDTRAFHITRWLRGGFFKNNRNQGTLSIFPLKEIWKWIDEDVEDRAWYLASFVPNALFRRDGETCLAREVLMRYGDREDVRRELMANFSTEGWVGKASSYHQEKKQHFLDLKEMEDNDNVKRWIDEYVSSLDQEIKQEKFWEERDEL